MNEIIRLSLLNYTLGQKKLNPNVDFDNNRINMKKDDKVIVDGKYGKINSINPKTYNITYHDGDTKDVSKTIIRPWNLYVYKDEDTFSYLGKFIKMQIYNEIIDFETFLDIINSSTQSIIKVSSPVAYVENDVLYPGIVNNINENGSIYNLYWHKDQFKDVSKDSIFLQDENTFYKFLYKKIHSKMVSTLAAEGIKKPDLDIKKITEILSSKNLKNNLYSVPPPVMYQCYDGKNYTESYRVFNHLKHNEKKEVQTKNDGFAAAVDATASALGQKTKPLSYTVNHVEEFQEKVTKYLEQSSDIWENPPIIPSKEKNICADDYNPKEDYKKRLDKYIFDRNEYYYTILDNTDPVYSEYIKDLNEFNNKQRVKDELKKLYDEELKIYEKNKTIIDIENKKYLVGMTDFFYKNTPHKYISYGFIFENKSFYFSDFDNFDNLISKQNFTDFIKNTYWFDIIHLLNEEQSKKYYWKNDKEEYLGEYIECRINNNNPDTYDKSIMYRFMFHDLTIEYTNPNYLKFLYNSKLNLIKDDKSRIELLKKLLILPTAEFPIKKKEYTKLKGQYYSDSTEELVTSHFPCEYLKTNYSISYTKGNILNVSIYFLFQSLDKGNVRYTVPRNLYKINTISNDIGLKNDINNTSMSGEDCIKSIKDQMDNIKAVNENVYNILNIYFQKRASMYEEKDINSLLYKTFLPIKLTSDKFFNEDKGKLDNVVFYNTDRKDSYSKKVSGFVYYMGDDGQYISFFKYPKDEKLFIKMLSYVCKNNINNDSLNNLLDSNIIKVELSRIISDDDVLFTDNKDIIPSLGKTITKTVSKAASAVRNTVGNTISTVKNTVSRVNPFKKSSGGSSTRKCAAFSKKKSRKNKLKSTFKKHNNTCKK